MILIYHNYVFAKTTTNYMNNVNFAVQSIRITVVRRSREWRHLVTNLNKTTVALDACSPANKNEH